MVDQEFGTAEIASAIKTAASALRHHARGEPEYLIEALARLCDGPEDLADLPLAEGGEAVKLRKAMEMARNCLCRAFRGLPEKDAETAKAKAHVREAISMLFTGSTGEDSEDREIPWSGPPNQPPLAESAVEDQGPEDLANDLYDMATRPYIEVLEKIALYSTDPDARSKAMRVVRRVKGVAE